MNSKGSTSSCHHRNFNPLLLLLIPRVVGNASPLAIRSTTYCLPRDGQTALLSRLPLGALVTPFMSPNAGKVGFKLLTLNLFFY